MKQEIVFEYLKKLKEKPNLMRKIKIFAVVGIVGFLITGALTIWAGMEAFNYVASKTNEVVQSTVALNHVENLKTELKALPKLQPLNCWGKVQSLMAVQPWLERPAIDNLVNLKLACLDDKSTVCEGDECTNMKNLINTAEGRTI